MKCNLYAHKLLNGSGSRMKQLWPGAWGAWGVG